MKRDVNPVENIQKTWRISAIRPFGFLDSQMFQAQTKKKKKPGKIAAVNKGKSKNHARQPEKVGGHIDLNA